MTRRTLSFFVAALVGVTTLASASLTSAHPASGAERPREFAPGAARTVAPRRDAADLGRTDRGASGDRGCADARGQRAAGDRGRARRVPDRARRGPRGPCRGALAPTDGGGAHRPGPGRSGIRGRRPLRASPRGGGRRRTLLGGLGIDSPLRDSREWTVRRCPGPCGSRDTIPPGCSGGRPAAPGRRRQRSASSPHRLTTRRESRSASASPWRSSVERCGGHVGPP